VRSCAEKTRCAPREKEIAGSIQDGQWGLGRGAECLDRLVQNKCATSNLMSSQIGYEKMNNQTFRCFVKENLHNELNHTREQVESLQKTREENKSYILYIFRIILIDSYKFLHHHGLLCWCVEEDKKTSEDFSPAKLPPEHVLGEQRSR
jgi:hypothetical protein